MRHTAGLGGWVGGVWRWWVALGVAGWPCMGASVARTGLRSAGVAVIVVIVPCRALCPFEGVVGVGVSLGGGGVLGVLAVGRVFISWSGEGGALGGEGLH